MSETTQRERICCPSCGMGNECTTPVDLKVERRPQEGDVSICWYCGTMCRFTEDLNLIEMTDQEVKKLIAEQPESIDLMKRTLTAIISRIKKQ